MAALANLELNEAETALMARQLDGILEHAAKLNELNVAGVEPMAQVLYDAGETAALRADAPAPSLDNATALANAPLAGSGFFKVPKVIER